MDRRLTWADIVQPDTQDPKHIESQQVEKERVYEYLNHCKERGLNPDSFNNYQDYQNQKS